MTLMTPKQLRNMEDPLPHSLPSFAGITPAAILGLLLALGPLATVALSDPPSPQEDSANLSSAEQSQSDQVSVEPSAAKEAAEEANREAAKGDADADDTWSAESPEEEPTITLEDLKNDPEFQAELKKRRSAFDATHQVLADALANQHAILVRYRNGDANSPKDQEDYRAAVVEVRQAIDDLFGKALDLVKISGDSDAAQYLVTVIKHRLEHSIYDMETAEGAARLIDGGGSLLYLFTAAARSAVCSGQFDVARRVYEAMSEEQMEDLDRRFIYQMDEIEERFLREQKLREEEEKADDLPRVLLRTSEGDIVIELFLNQAPSTVANFIRLVEEGFYDGVDFHQVIEDVLALTGDPSGLGDGHSGKFLIDEHERPDARDAFRGSLVMAKLPKGKDSLEFYPNTASSQFAILMVPLIGMEQQQTVFGRVIDGMHVIAALRRIDPSKEKKKGEIVLPSDYIIEATVIRRPESLPEPKYVNDAAVSGVSAR